MAMDEEASLTNNVDFDRVREASGVDQHQHHHHYQHQQHSSELYEDVDYEVQELTFEHVMLDEIVQQQFKFSFSDQGAYDLVDLGEAMSLTAVEYLVANEEQHLDTAGVTADNQREQFNSEELTPAHLDLNAEMRQLFKFRHSLYKQEEERAAAAAQLTASSSEALSSAAVVSDFIWSQIHIMRRLLLLPSSPDAATALTVATAGKNGVQLFQLEGGIDTLSTSTAATVLMGSGALLILLLLLLFRRCCTRRGNNSSSRSSHGEDDDDSGTWSSSQVINSPRNQQRGGRAVSAAEILQRASDCAQRVQTAAAAVAASDVAEFAAEISALQADIRESFVGRWQLLEDAKNAEQLLRSVKTLQSNLRSMAHDCHSTAAVTSSNGSDRNGTAATTAAAEEMGDGRDAEERLQCHRREQRLQSVASGFDSISEDLMRLVLLDEGNHREQLLAQVRLGVELNDSHRLLEGIIWLQELMAGNDSPQHLLLCSCRDAESALQQLYAAEDAAAAAKFDCDLQQQLREGERAFQSVAAGDVMMAYHWTMEAAKIRRESSAARESYQRERDRERSNSRQAARLHVVAENKKRARELRNWEMLIQNQGESRMSEKRAAFFAGKDVERRLSRDLSKQKARQQLADSAVFSLALAAAALLYLAIYTRFWGMRHFHHAFNRMYSGTAAAGAVADDSSVEHVGIEHFYRWLLFNLRQGCALLSCASSSSGGAAAATSTDVPNVLRGLQQWGVTYRAGSCSVMQGVNSGWHSTGNDRNSISSSSSSSQSLFAYLLLGWLGSMLQRDWLESALDSGNCFLLLLLRCLPAAFFGWIFNLFRLPSIAQWSRLLLLSIGFLDVLLLVALGPLFPLLLLLLLHLLLLHCVTTAERKRLKWRLQIGSICLDLRPICFRILYPVLLIVLAAVVAYAQHFMGLQQELPQQRFFDSTSALQSHFLQLLRAFWFGLNCVADFTRQT